MEEKVLSYDLKWMSSLALENLDKVRKAFWTELTGDTRYVTHNIDTQAFRTIYIRTEHSYIIAQYIDYEVLGDMQHFLLIKELYVEPTFRYFGIASQLLYTLKNEVITENKYGLLLGADYTLKDFYVKNGLLPVWKDLKQNSELFLWTPIPDNFQKFQDSFLSPMEN